MAIYTYTASQAYAAVVPKAEINRNITVPFYANVGSQITSISGAILLLCKIPHGATILDYGITHTCGAATCTSDYGYRLADGSATFSTFASAQAKATLNKPGPLVGNTAFSIGVPFKKSLSDDAVDRFYYFTGKYLPGSATTSLIVQGYVTYTMDGI
jgi:hypothetical protein